MLRYRSLLSSNVSQFRILNDTIILDSYRQLLKSLQLPNTLFSFSISRYRLRESVYATKAYTDYSKVHRSPQFHGKKSWIIGGRTLHAVHRNDPWTRAEAVRKPRVKNRRRARGTARRNVLPEPRIDNLWRNDVRTIDLQARIVTTFVYVQATFRFVLVSARVYRSNNNTFQLFTLYYDCITYGDCY